MDLAFINTLKSLVNIDIKDVELREKLLENLENDRIKKKFELDKYIRYYDNFGILGKTQLDVWKADKSLSKFYRGIGLVLAVSKFRRGLRNE
jgi:hypothetical protein